MLVSGKMELSDDCMKEDSDERENKMKQLINVEKKQETLSLITQIAYANVSSWYNCSRRDLYMDLIVPKTMAGHERMPAIVWICGGAFRVVDRSVWIPELLHFARAGYVVASVDYRTGNEAAFPQPLMDIKAAIRYLKAHSAEYCIDPDRIFIMGESAGGTLAALAGTTVGKKEYEVGEHLEYDSSVAGVVDFYGITSFTESPYVIPDLTVNFLGADYSEETAEAASAVCQADENTPPFLILHGAGDSRVPLKQSEVLYEKLLEKGVETELWILEDAAHGADLFYQDEVLARVIQFLEQQQVAFPAVHSVLE